MITGGMAYVLTWLVTLRVYLGIRVAVIIYISFLILSYIGLFKATASDPSTSARHYSGVYGKMARVCTLCFMLMSPLLFLFFNEGYPIVVHTMKQTSRYWTPALSSLLVGVSVICLMICLRRLFHRAGWFQLRQWSSIKIG